jgi:hypothetical protein
LINGAETVPRALDAVDLDGGVDRDPNPLGFVVQLGYCVRIHVGEHPRQHFEDCHLSSRSGVDMAEFERDDAAPDKHDARGQGALAQHIVGSDHQFGAGKV